MLTAVLLLGSPFPMSCQEIARCDNIDAARTRWPQEMIVVGDERRVHRGAQGSEFPVVRVRDHGEGIWIDRPGKFSLGREEIGTGVPIEEGNPPQGSPGLPRRGRVPDR